MPGLLDFLFQGQGGQGGGLLGMLGQQGGQGGMQMGADGMPMQISPGPQQQMLNVPNLPQQQPMQQPGMTPQMPQGGGMAGSLDPSFFANQVRQNQQPPGMLFNADSGLLGGMRGALNQISDPQGQRQQQAIQNYLAVKAAEEKPQYMKIQDPATGIERLVQIQPFGRGAGYVNPAEPSGAAPAPADTSIPPGSDVKTVREARGKAAVANEEDAVKSAKAAADFAPAIDQAVAAYERAHAAGATGPVIASPAGRAIGKYVTGSDAEKARQDYDLAIASVKARVTAAQNKGEGQVSNFERQMYGAQFPDLQALDPQSQLQVLRQLQAQTHQTVAAGKIPALGQTPSVTPVLNRPSIPGGLPQQGAPPAQGAPAAPGGPAIAPPSAPVRVTTQAQYNLLPSGSPYIAPDGSPRTKR